MTSNNPLDFDLKPLLSRVRELRSEYIAAEPFPHVVIDDFFPTAIADLIAEEYPVADQETWKYSGDTNSNRIHKFSSQDEAQLGMVTRWVLHQLNGWDFLKCVEALTGIAHLLPDPNIGQSLRHFTTGGCLGVHVDFNWNKQLQLYRRVNLIIYMNRTWQREYGGELELWDPDLDVCGRKVTPGWNRAILFTTNDRTPHGFPDPLRCPVGVTRKSIQLYYYTSAPADSSAPFRAHGTIFSTALKDKVDKRPDNPHMLKNICKEITPPFIWRGMKRIYRKVR